MSKYCIVPGGGLKDDNTWKSGKNNGKFLFPVKAMSKVFKGRFIQALKNELPDEINRDFLYRLNNKNWVVYAKRPFATPRYVIEYLGRYTHKIAISNHRIQNITDTEVTFSYMVIELAVIEPVEMSK